MAKTYILIVKKKKNHSLMVNSHILMVKTMGFSPKTMGEKNIKKKNM